jgi:hypothetical protein
MNCILIANGTAFRKNGRILVLDLLHYLPSKELSLKLTDEQQIFIPESSVYRILKSRRLMPRLLLVFSWTQQMNLLPKQVSLSNVTNELYLL